MKKIICLLLIGLLLLTGYQEASPETTAPSETVVLEETTVPEETTVAPTLSEETMPIQTVPDMAIGQQTGDEIGFSNPGKVRLEYTGNRSYVRYITSVDQLPDEEALKGYDEDFFEHSALLIVVETVGSGSLQLEIDAIHVSGDTATVTLERSMPGDVGTTDMATWLLWVEVEKGLDYTWTLENGSQQSQGEKY